MENKFLQVLSKLNHNGTEYQIGSFIEGTMEEFGGLVESKVLRVIDAKDLAEAKAIAAKGTVVAAPVQPVAKPNTWEAKPDQAASTEAKADVGGAETAGGNGSGEAAKEPEEKKPDEVVPGEKTGTPTGDNL